MNFALNPIFQIRRRTSPVIVAALVGCAVNGIGLVVLSRFYGPAGIAVAQSLGLAAAVALLSARALLGPERLAMPWRDIGLSAAASLTMLVALAPLRHLDPALALGLCLGLGVALYAAAVWIFDIAGLRAVVTERFGLRQPVPAE